MSNSDNGQSLLHPFMRRLLGLVYDGRLEAAGDVSAAAKRIQAEIAKERELVSRVPDPEASAKLAASYVNPDLGIKVTRNGSDVRFDFRTLGSPLGAKKNDDGTISFVGLDPTILFYPLVVGTKDWKRALTARDSQHEFVFVGN